MIKERELYDMIASGDMNLINRAISRIRESIYPKIKNYILNNNGNTADAEDVIQDGLLSLYDNILLERFKQESSIETYLFAICKNKWLSKIKKERKNDTNIRRETSDIDFVNIDSRLIEDVMNQLSSNCRKLLHEFYYNQSSMKDIMHLFDLKTEQSAKNKKYLCMKKLTEEVRKRKLKIESFIKES